MAARLVLGSMLGARRTDATLLGLLCAAPRRLSLRTGDEEEARGPRYELGGGPALSGTPERPRCGAGRNLLILLWLDEVIEVVRVRESSATEVDVDVVRVAEVVDKMVDPRRLVRRGVLFSSDCFLARNSALRLERGGATGGRVLATAIDSARL